MFCPSCGNQARETTPPKAGFTVDDFVSSLERYLLPDGTLVLARELFRRSPARLEVVSDEDTSCLTADDRDRLVDFLTECLGGDAYLYGEIDLGGPEGNSCLWHVVNTMIIPLVSEHAEAIVGLYPVLIPGGSSGDDLLEWTDAPNLSATDQPG